MTAAVTLGAILMFGLGAQEVRDRPRLTAPNVINWLHLV
jgi:hypothetical protein